MPTASSFPLSTSSLNASEVPSSDFCTDPFLAICPNDEVTALMSKYSQLTSLSPAVESIVQDSSRRRLVYDVLEQHVNLVKSRSQAFEDAHITVYDKALLEITANGTDLYLIGAVQLFVDEIVGIAGLSKGKGVSVEKVLATNVALRSLLSYVSRPAVEASGPVRPNTKESSYAKEELRPGVKKSNWPEEFKRVDGNTPSKSDNEPWASNDSHPSYEAKDSQDAKAANVRETKDSQTTKDSLSRMMETFVKARREYEATADTDVVAKCHAAKFLRDTTENALNYLRFWKIEDHPMVPDLHTSLEIATEKAIALSGGRKRHFEMVDAPIGPRNRDHLPYSTHRPSRGRSQGYRVSAEDSPYRRRKYDATHAHREHGYRHQEYERGRNHRFY